MTCEERKDLLALYAMNALGSQEQSEISAHLQGGCPVCTGYLAEVEVILDLLPLGLAPVNPSPEIKARLLERIASGKSSLHRQARPTPALHRVQFRRVADAFIGGAIAAAIGVIAVMLLLDQNRRQIESLRMQVVRHDELIGSLQTTIQATGKTMRMLESPSVQVVAALGTEVQPTASARVFLDKSQGAVSFYASGLKPLPADKTYELWLINDKQKPIAAGTFDVNRAGEASLERKVPAEAGHIVLVAVTEEPAGGVPQPTGAIQIKGTIQ